MPDTPVDCIGCKMEELVDDSCSFIMCLGANMYELQSRMIGTQKCGGLFPIPIGEGFVATLYVKVVGL